jgi:transposase
VYARLRYAWRSHLFTGDLAVAFIGIDAHKDTLAAAAIDEHGRQLDAGTFPNEPHGYSELVQWATQFGITRIGIEGSGSLGRQAALALQNAGFVVVDVPPQLTALGRRHGRNQSKTDPIDALIIARIVLREQELPAVRTGGDLEDVRLLVHYRRELIAERTRLASRLHGDLEQLRPGYQANVRRLTTHKQLDRAHELLDDLVCVRARLARQRVARLRALCVEIDQLTTELRSRGAVITTALTAIIGIAELTAAEILAEVGDVKRFRTKAQFAMANGTAPLPASSGRTNRHRLNHGGNRQLNRILHFIALTQVSRSPEGRAYYDRKRSEGRTKQDALRCLKRRISDRVFQTLRQ